VAGAVVTAALAVGPQASADTSLNPQIGFDVAFSHNGMLDVWGCNFPHGGVGGACGSVQFGPALAPGTSPSIAKVGTNGYEVAYQATNGDLSILGSLGTGDLHLGMMAGTSPAITIRATGDYEIAMQDNTGELWTVGPNFGTIQWGLPMDHASSPSIAPFGTTSFEAAYTTNTDSLAYAGADGTGVQSTGAVAPGTSPSIWVNPSTSSLLNSPNIAFQSSCGVLNVMPLANHPVPFGCVGDGMSPGSSPSITDTPADVLTPQGGIEVAFNELDGQLFGSGNQIEGPANTPRNPNGINIFPGSSPTVLTSIVPAYLGAKPIPGGFIQPGQPIPGYEMFYEDLSGNLRWVLASAFTNSYVDPASPIGTIDSGTRPSAISFE
jgi:hypothetical protein